LIEAVFKRKVEKVLFKHKCSPLPILGVGMKNSYSAEKMKRLPWADLAWTRRNKKSKTKRCSAQ